MKKPTKILEIKYLTEKGEYGYGEIKLSPIEKNNEIYGIVGVLRDQTESELKAL